MGTPMLFVAAIKSICVLNRADFWVFLRKSRQPLTKIRFSIFETGLLGTGFDQR